MFKIKPKAGLIIRDPDSFEPLAENGEIKARTSYWLNHLKNGDVELVLEDDDSNTADAVNSLSPSRRKGEK